MAKSEEGARPSGGLVPDASVGISGVNVRAPGLTRGDTGDLGGGGDLTGEPGELGDPPAMAGINTDQALHSPPEQNSSATLGEALGVGAGRADVGSGTPSDRGDAGGGDAGFEAKNAGGTASMAGIGDKGHSG